MRYPSGTNSELLEENSFLKQRIKELEQSEAIRKQTEEALLDSKEQYRFVVENLKEVVFRTDAEGHWTFLNSAWAEVTGFTVEESLGKVFLEYVYPEDRQLNLELFRPLIERKKDYCRHEIRYMHKAEGFRYIEVWARLTLDEKGNAAGTAGTLTDITERNEAEQKIIESEQSLQAILTASPIGIGRTRNRVIDWVNEPLCRMSGYTPEEVKGKKTRLFYESNEEYERAGKILYEEGQVETKLRKKNGEVGHVLAQLSQTDNLSYIFTVTDITWQKEAEEALRESEAKYRAVVENSLVGFYIIQDNLFRFVNKKWCETYGYTYEEVVDKKMDPMDLVHPDDRARVEENLRKRFAGEANIIEHEFRTIKKDGTIVAIKVLGGTVLYKGRPAVMGTFLDITRERTLESQLRRAEKMEAIGTLAGGIAHDFNNILTALVGYAALLKMKLNRGSLHTYVDQILSASQKATDLIQSLLTFSRQQAVSLKPVSLHNVIKGAEKLLKRLVTEDIAIKTLLATEDITIMADKTQIDQILFNLATNARDAMPQGGTLTVETKAVELNDEFKRFHGYGEPGRYALLLISDTGMGMDEATRKRIFDPFFTTKEVGKGTGLGLSTVYGIVQQHNGYITVYSEPGIGTTFQIYLPVANEIGKEENLAPDAVKGGNETILVAEDNEAVRDFMSGCTA